jgi:DNA-binding NtrC family response regulator
LRDGCGSVLRLDGYSVSIAGRGDEALDILGRQRFDVILLDLYMTPVAGMDILRAALAANKDTLVIVMTGNPSVASSLEALRAGAWDYLPKPFSAAQLQVLIGRAAHSVQVAHETTAQRARATADASNGDGSA